MKKKHIFPGLILGLVFTGYLTFQVGFDILNSNANIKNLDEQTKLYHEKLFKKFDYKSSQGSQIKLQEIKQPIIILNFWAAWCLPCLKEMPSMVELETKFGDKVKIVGVNIDSERPEIQIAKIEQQLKLSFQSISDPQSKILDEFKISNIPASIIYKQGKVIYFEQKNTDFMSAAILELIK